MDQKDRTCFLLGFGLLISNRSANLSFEIWRGGIHLVYRAPIHMYGNAGYTSNWPSGHGKHKARKPLHAL